MTPVLARRWTCAARHCTSEAVTYDGKTPMHTCGQTRGLLVPLVPAGTNAAYTVIEREDYVGSEAVQTDRTGRPVMAVRTSRDEGQDTTVYAPTATITRELE